MPSAAKKTAPKVPLRVQKALEVAVTHHPKREAMRKSIGATKGGRTKLETYKRNGSAAQCALISPDKPLTDMQKAFARLWAQGENISNAALKAGYADSNLGYRLARQPNVLAVYYAEKKAFEKVNDMSRKRAMDGFLEAIEYAKMVEEPSSMIAGWREIAKMCGYYEPVKVQVNHTHEGKVIEDRLNSLSNDELMELIAQRAASIAGGGDAGSGGAPDQ